MVVRNVAHMYIEGNGLWCVPPIVKTELVGTSSGCPKLKLITSSAFFIEDYATCRCSHHEVDPGVIVAPEYVMIDHHIIADDKVTLEIHVLIKALRSMEGDLQTIAGVEQTKPENSQHETDRLDMHSVTLNDFFQNILSLCRLAEI